MVFVMSDGPDNARECSKKHALSLSEGSVQQGRSHFDARSILSGREHGKTATMSVRADQTKPENTAGLSAVALAKVGGFFQHSHAGQPCRRNNVTNPPVSPPAGPKNFYKAVTSWFPWCHLHHLSFIKMTEV